MKFSCITLTFSTGAPVENWVRIYKGTVTAVSISLQTQRTYLHQRTLTEARVHLVSVLLLQQFSHYPMVAMEVTFYLWNSHAEGLKINAHFSLNGKMKGYHFPLNNIENEVVLKKTAHKICQSNFNIYLYYFYCFYFLYILIKMYHVPPFLSTF